MKIYEKILIAFLLMGIPLMFNNKMIFAEVPNLTKDFRYMAREIMDATSEQLCREYNFKLVGTRAAMMDNVESIGLDFDLEKKLTREQSREIIVNCVNLFLDKINNNLEIRPFLKQYPFTARNVSITIYLSTPSSQELYDPDLCVISSYGNKVHYKTNDPENKYVYKSKISEPFDEAVKIVQQSKCN